MVKLREARSKARRQFLKDKGIDCDFADLESRVEAEEFAQRKSSYEFSQLKHWKDKLELARVANGIKA